MSTIRTLFSTARPIDRPIEKVIDYSAADDKRLAREIEEYEVTDNVEACFRKFLEHFGAGVRTGDVTEIGIWVSGFYGSGKSSYTKYLGFSLDPHRKVAGKPFLDLLCDRLHSADVKAQLRTLAAQQPTAVIMLDLGAEQLASTATAPVTTVLYWKVLQWAGYSTEKKIAELEFKLEELKQFERFQAAYRERFPGKGEWRDVHNDPLLGVARADRLVPEFLREDFANPGDFRSHKFEQATDARQQARRMIDLVRRKTGYQNVLFLIDEAGQYVAPRGELILNLDGLARNLKELGKGKVWIIATGQQTLTEIVERAAYNSAELYKLRDRFPINIELDPKDIKKITYLRLLTKSAAADDLLTMRFKDYGPAAINFTRLKDTALFKGDPDADTFARFYPFLPHHFDLLIELIRALARSTGGIGLRSVIRVIQDLLVDASKSLPPGEKPLADRPINTLAGADDFFDVLRADIGKVLPHVLLGVERVEQIFADDLQAVRVAKAIAALQPVENFPRSAENIAALLYPALDAPGELESVKEALRKLLNEKECSIVEDQQSGGYLFLSEGIKIYRDKRNAYVPSSSEVNQLRHQLLARIFDPLPAARLENVKEVKAELRYGKVPVAGEGADVQLRVEPAAPASFDARREELLIDTNSKREYENTIALLVSFPEELDDALAEARRSDFILGTISERDADKDVAQFLRSERASLNRNQDEAVRLMKKALLQTGLFVFRGKPLPVAEAGETLDAACRRIVEEAAKKVFPKFALVPLRPNTDLAAKFLEIERLDKIPSERDPLHFVAKSGGGRYAVQVKQDALAETLRTFREMVDTAGSGRIQGKALQDRFARPEYGWQKDATRYVFAALFRAGEIQLHTGEGTLTTVGPQAVEAFKSTVSFNRVGISLRNTRPSLEVMDRASQRLEEIFAIEVLPLEEHISRAVRTHFPNLIEEIGSLPDRLRLLGLPGFERAQQLLQTSADLLKEDASGAALVLGALDSSLPADITWAQAVVKALAGDGEQTLRLAHGLLTSLEEVEELFPGSTRDLVSDGQRSQIEESRRSERFYESLPNLRGAIREVLDRVVGRYQQLRQSFLVDLDEARTRLEAMPEWSALTPEDRADVGGQWSRIQIPEKARAGREIADFRLLCSRRTGLASMLDSLRSEITRRVPPAPLRTLVGRAQVDTASVFTVPLRELVPSGSITNVKELQDWLAQVQSRLQGLLSEYREIRIE